MKNGSMFVHQSKYACSIINKLNLKDAKALSISIDKYHTLDHQDDSEILN